MRSDSHRHEFHSSFSLPIYSQRICKKGIEILDAPVSGGQEKAQSGTLAIMVGGKEEIFTRCKPILGVLGKEVLVGAIGTVGITKLVNQAIMAVNIVVVTEALLLGKKAGVYPQRIFSAIQNGLAGSQSLTDKAPRMFSGKYDPEFRIKLHVKDLTNVLQTSQVLHNAIPLTAQVMEMMQTLMADGHRDVNDAGLALFYEKMNNLKNKKKKKMDFKPRGIIPPMITPFNKEEKVDCKTLKQMINYLIDAGVHGVFPLGSTGERYGIDFEQKRKVIETVVEVTNERVPI